MELTLKPIVVVGPTASGKTGRAVSLAEHFNGEIISADSRQLYRGMTIGTGKDLEEYNDIPYHLIDVANAGDKLNLFVYLKLFNEALEDVSGRGKRPIICGGTGMYVENAINGIRLPEVPENTELRAELASLSLEELTRILKEYKTLHNTTDVDNCKRAIRAIEIAEYYKNHPEEYALTQKRSSEKLDALVVGIDIPRDDRRRRITERLDMRLKQGMVEEIEALIRSGISPESLIYYGLEYKFITEYVIGKLSYAEMYKQLETAIHQFAKRQMTWFRGMEKRGTKIHWLRYDLTEDEFLKAIEQQL